jgi:hypothetical protein
LTENIRELIGFRASFLHLDYNHTLGHLSNMQDGLPVSSCEKVLDRIGDGLPVSTIEKVLDRIGDGLPVSTIEKVLDRIGEAPDLWRRALD